MVLCKAGSSLRESVVGAFSLLVQGAWAGPLVHFSGLDVFGPTADAVARLLQNRRGRALGGNGHRRVSGRTGLVCSDISPSRAFT
jgi:hypothetical protein